MSARDGRRSQGRRRRQGGAPGEEEDAASGVQTRRDGGTTITEASLDGLNGWNSGWFPPFETRPGTRERTPEAIVLRPLDGRFASDGNFERLST